MKDIEKYIKTGGIVIMPDGDGYVVFTPDSKSFAIKHLSDLTPEKFDSQTAWRKKFDIAYNKSLEIFGKAAEEIIGKALFDETPT